MSGRRGATIVTMDPPVHVRRHVHPHMEERSGARRCAAFRSTGRGVGRGRQRVVAPRAAVTRLEPTTGPCAFSSIWTPCAGGSPRLFAGDDSIGLLGAYARGVPPTCPTGPTGRRHWRAAARAAPPCKAVAGGSGGAAGRPGPRRGVPRHTARRLAPSRPQTRSRPPRSPPALCRFPLAVGGLRSVSPRSIDYPRFSWRGCGVVVVRTCRAMALASSARHAGRPPADGDLASRMRRSPRTCWMMP